MFPLKVKVKAGRTNLTCLLCYPLASLSFKDKNQIEIGHKNQERDGQKKAQRNLEKSKQI